MTALEIILLVALAIALYFVAYFWRQRNAYRQWYRSATTFRPSLLSSAESIIRVAAMGTALVSLLVLIRQRLNSGNE